ncbi:Protein ecdysoneless -like protein [Triplophysa tibetana]|uniref:Protein ecdysoneless-like protein n=1 Tax=Triplophysa tibetana TaxID=1572043 RepID=A0A5A9NQ51_9TELE|nr:Protein ecdysoneless -like protein [Triplophysa tibetana]
MDALRRPAIPEDAVRYKLFLVQPDPSDAEANEKSLQQLLENILAEIAPLLVQYIWQHQPFNLTYHPEKGGEPANLGGVTVFGENLEDEWFIVYLLKGITCTFKEVAAVVNDNDGQFLLIEAAEHLPKWLDPDSSENRVFLYQGELHILPNPLHPGEIGWPKDSVPTVVQALEMLHLHTEHCLARKPIRSALAKRLDGYPDKIQQNFHHAHCYIPAGIAAVLSRSPDLLAPAVSAFYLRDPLDLQACRTFRTFPPDTRVMTSAKFTRCLYAQLNQQSFIPDRRSGFTLPPRTHPQYKAHELGMKLAHGFEILCSKSGQSSSVQEPSVSSNPLWRGFLDSLKKNGYFKAELEGSARYKDLMMSAENFFKQSITSTHRPDIYNPGDEVFKILRDASYSFEDLKQQEAHLPPEDSDAWLDISPQELERLLEERGGRGVSDSTIKTVGPENEEQEEETGYSLVAVTQGMKSFINAMSSHEGAEFPRSCLSDPFNFDPDAVTSALDRLLGNKDDELDSDDFEDDFDGDEEDNENKDEEVQNDDSVEHTDADTLESLRKYMDEMDHELQSTNIGKSFSQTNKVGNKSDTTKISSVTAGSELAEEEIQPLDVDLNLVTNLLESLASQAGLAGPASNLLQSIGIHIPPDADK